MRQRHCSSLPSEEGRGGGSLAGPLSPLMEDTTDLPGLGDSPASPTHSFSFECTSRQSITLQAFYQIDPRLFKQIFNLLPMLHIDLFATVRNAQHPVFLSPFPDMSAKGVDALSHSWDFPGVLYAFPPTPLLTVVLGRIREASRPVLLLAPAWTKQPWYSSLTELSIAHAVCLPLGQFPLLQGDWIHPSSRMFSLHAWTLCGNDTGSTDSLHELPTTWLSRFGFQRPRSMTVSGTPSVLGVQRDRLILSLSL